MAATTRARYPKSEATADVCGRLALGARIESRRADRPRSKLRQSRASWSGARGQGRRSWSTQYTKTLDRRMNAANGRPSAVSGLGPSRRHTYIWARDFKWFGFQTLWVKCLIGVGRFLW